MSKFNHLLIYELFLFSLLQFPIKHRNLLTSQIYFRFYFYSVSVPNLAIGFSAYGTMKEKILTHEKGFHVFGISLPLKDPHTGHLNAIGSMSCGAFSGVLSSLITFPADVIRRRMQVMGLSSATISSSASSVVSSSISAAASTAKEPIFLNLKPSSSSSAYQEAKKLIRTEGMRGMYRGIVPELLKVTPMVGITFSVFEYIQNEIFSH